MGLSDFYTTNRVSEEEGIKLIRDAFARGINHFDTADAYGPFHNEILLGTLCAHMPCRTLHVSLPLRTLMQAKQSKDYHERNSSLLQNSPFNVPKPDNF